LEQNEVLEPFLNLYHRESENSLHEYIHTESDQPLISELEHFHLLGAGLFVSHHNIFQNSDYFLLLGFASHFEVRQRQRTLLIDEYPLFFLAL